jgi:Protein of unknown function, DUF481
VAACGGRGHPLEERQLSDWADRPTRRRRTGSGNGIFRADHHRQVVYRCRGQCRSGRNTTPGANNGLRHQLLVPDEKLELVGEHRIQFDGGDAETSALTAGSKSTRITPKDKFTFSISNYWSNNRAIPLNIHVLWGEARYQCYLPGDRWFAWSAAEYERDPGKRVVMRVAPGAGLGDHAVKKKDTSLELYSGVDWNRAWYDGAAERNSAEFVVATCLRGSFCRRRISRRLSASIRAFEGRAASPCPGLDSDSETWRSRCFSTSPA